MTKPTFRESPFLRDRRVPHVPARNPHCATAFTDIDLDAPGRQAGFLHIPQSPHEDAWGTVRIPMAVLANGDGPTVILEGGNHGDEYEGQIVLGEFIRDLPLERVRGRLIIMPSLNAPAAEAGRRTSPLDGKNLNRSFPGDHAGSITEQIAAYVSDELFPRGDAFLSLHSGGSSLDIIPSALVQPSADAQQTQRNTDAVLAFGAPFNVLLDTLGDTRTSVATAVAAGLTCVSTEMAGRGTVTDSALELCRAGALRVLAHWGVLDQACAQPLDGQPAPLHKVTGAKSYVIASERGVFEAYHRHGVSVEAGQPAGRIHQIFDPQRAPVELLYGASGVVFAKRHPGIVVPGNVCCVVASRA
ncbi:succinylglutamate desuccinylase [Achromobacter insolitus]|uniref:N-alpha-acetyl-L-2,4-diaminobutyric acid deacetylase n=1 Tax=Achromobacter insolitus TaxID=217204 RepID=A0A6S7FIA0_9BURK|nr:MULTISPECIES: succinylglutamate desuccinylase/aspartoacylase family protein [Achromobacter]AVG42772.1 succinylglutamate desuccinylase [Achromobacter insolitus]AXA73158.1 succinylglutamate desuccinylase [Achromobacter insolitus]MEB3099356.1 succinylglutamate desuccinylase/aspartoacylase family protein [Achromobacter sp. D10]OAE50778.1 succinylglutamate desuccinylase [Achromobacter insolitus]OCZ58859.1 succinylglutamate desuccinylase [Achromobacter insolitus]